MLMSVSFNLVKKGRSFEKIEFRIIPKEDFSERMKVFANIDERLDGKSVPKEK